METTETIILIAFLLGFILSSSYGEAMRLREGSEVEPKEKLRLKNLWHHLQWLERATGIFMGYFAAIAFSHTGITWMNLLQLLSFLGIVGSMFWWIYDGSINSFRHKILPWHHVSTYPGNWMEPFSQWYTKLTVFLISVGVFTYLTFM